MNKIIIIFLFFTGCSTTPMGRKQLKLVDSERMASIGNQSFGKIIDTKQVSHDPKLNRFVQCVSNRVLESAGENPSEWKVKVFKDDSPNAFALPGKNIGVHTGMLDLVKNQDQLAAVIGHEVGHVKANHGNERVSQNILAQGGLLTANILIDDSTKKGQAILAGIGLGAQFGILLPFSRKHERESDHLGVRYMSKAGFNPKEAAQLWREMEKISKGSPPEFLSTHPSNKSRIKDLEQLAKKYEAQYLSAVRKTSCYFVD